MMIMMNNKIFEELYKKNDLLFYLRTHPEWYKILNRHPNMYNQFTKLAKEELKNTLYHKLDRFKNQVQLLTLINEYMNR